MYKLTKERILGVSVHKPCQIFISDCGKWLSNGEWAIRREAVEDGHLLSSPDALRLRFGKLAEDGTGPSADKALAKLSPTPERFERTWLIVQRRPEHSVQEAVYFGASSGNLVFVAPLYANLFGETLYGTPREDIAENGAWTGYLTTLPLAEGGPRAIVMSMTGPKAEIVAACRRALVGESQP